jgi:hypothetical protein
MNYEALRKEMDIFNIDDIWYAYILKIPSSGRNDVNTMSLGRPNLHRLTGGWEEPRPNDTTCLRHASSI